MGRQRSVVIVAIGWMVLMVCMAVMRATKETEGQSAGRVKGNDSDAVDDGDRCDEREG